MVILALLGVSFFSFSQDTTILGVKVIFNYSASIFPPSWQVSPIYAKGEPVVPSETKRCKLSATRALSKYPASLLKLNLTAVYYLKSMKFYNVGYGGTNSNNALYLTDDGASMGYTDLYMEQTFHHEFSSILFRNNASFLDTSAWMKANVPEFDYNDPEKGVGAIRNNKSSQEFDSLLCSKGFLTQYALSGMENDINTVAQNLFSPSEGFWNYVERFTRIKQKVNLLINFYNRLDPVFTEDYFRKMKDK